ncbi:MAG: DNA polymerase III subunit gamma/tau [Actinomycetota bacterium]
MAEEREYQSLYRKYRPQGPEEILGQEHVVRALMGAVSENRLAHAFLFTGPRGTGKTSTARILAKMVNCEKGPTPEPCGVCEQCVTIREGTHLDVVEIDAASHGGVDDARDLREKAPTSPVQGREKVYIIDEAQRLSREAFDALLKVFEEPPAGVRFVLATTEPHKMPATIVGRCQRFDFRRGSTHLVADHLQRIAKEEHIALSAEAAAAMARQSEGSFRDALSLLDQASLLGSGEITEEVLASLLGAPRGEAQYELVDAIAVGDGKAVFAVVQRLVEAGLDLRQVNTEMLTHLRNLLLVNAAPGQEDLTDTTPEEYERIRAQAAKLSTAEISRVIGLLLKAQEDMRWTTSPRLTLELALIRATVPEADPTPQALFSRIERLERLAGVPTGSAAGTEAPPAPAPLPQPPAAAKPEAEPEPKKPAKKSSKKAAAEEPPVEIPEAEENEVSMASAPATPLAQSADGSPNVDVEMLRRSWKTLIDNLWSAHKPVLKASLELATPVAYDGTTLQLAFPPDQRFIVAKVEAKEEELQGALQELFGISPKIACIVREPVAGPPVVDDDEDPLSEEEVIARMRAELGASDLPAPEGS